MGQMKNKKLMKILIIAISAVAILIAGILAFIFLGVSSPKKQFFKYIAQIADSENGLWDSRINQYMDKKETNSYNDTLQFFVNADLGDDELNEKLKDFTITSSGTVDKTNDSTSQNISLNYSENEKYPFKYRKVGNVMGLQIDDISTDKYVGIDISDPDKLPDDLAEMATNLNTLFNSLQEIETVKNTETNNSEDSKILANYVEIVMNSFNDKSFEKVEQENLKGYKLKITAEDVKNIITNVLTNLKDDQIALDKINELLSQTPLSTEITSSDIETAIQNINEAWDNEEGITNIKKMLEELLKDTSITVYSENNKLAKIEITVNSFNYAIEKVQNNDSYALVLSFTTVGDENVEAISFAIDYSGLGSMQEVKENYKLEVSARDYSISYNVVYETSFQQTDAIEEFTNQNSVILNNFPKENTEKLVEQINELITEKLGLYKYDCPLNLINPLYALTGNTESALDESIQSSEITQMKQLISNQVSEAVTDYYDEIYVNNAGKSYSTEEKNKLLANLVSQKILGYIDILNESGARILYNNSELSEDNMINELPATIEVEGLFDVEISENGQCTFTDKYSASGVKRNTNISEEEIANFNAEYEMYASPNLPGVTTKGLLSIIDANNESNKYQFKIEEINFNGEEYEATQQNIASIKEELYTGSEYRVEFEKEPETGAIYRAVINENG